MRAWFVRHFGVVLGVVYLVSRFWGLDLLPVFADEAIYIRWSQMINNDLGQYLFLPLYDGKTPLFMWILSLLLPLARAYPVLIGRLVSVTAGLGTAMMLILITKHLEGGRLAQRLTFCLYILLPFTFFNDRMALTDSLLCLALSLTFWLLLILKERQTWFLAIMTGIAFGLSLLAKLPALLFLPEFVLILWFMPPKLSRQPRRMAAVKFGAAAILGLAMLYSLRLSPLFPFLFTRGSDFTFGRADFLRCEGEVNCSFTLEPWLNNVGRFWRWQLWYSTIGLWLLLVIIPWIKTLRKSRRVRYSLYLVGMAFFMAGYFVVAGKILYSRYLLPTVLFLIPAGALSLEVSWRQMHRGLFWAISGLILVQSVWFMIPFWTDVTRAHLPTEDIEQYLTSWSAGFGNRAVATYIQAEAQRGPLAVATEGYFGTLPDGLSIYFDGSPVNENVHIFGIGQPVTSIPQELYKTSGTMPTYLVVNENRMRMPVQLCCQIVDRYPRPYGGADLLLLKVVPR